MSDDKIRVLVVEDSPTVREFLVATFDGTPDMRVVATARNGHDAVRAVLDTRPDVVTMDVAMEGMDGLDATRRIMREHPVPIVVVSSTLEARGAATFQALEAGALAFVRTPTLADDRTAADLVETVRLMSEVKVVRRRKNAADFQTRTEVSAPLPVRSDVRVVAIGASTGGPPAILGVLGGLPKDGIAPILIVQHIAPGFGVDFVEWLRQATGHSVSIAVDGEPLVSGHVYVAPDGAHMGVTGIGKIALSQAPPEKGLRPAVSHLFRSVRDAYGGSAAAVLLSGMGADGAKELLDLRDAGAVTFAQDAGSALVFGMPGEAIRLNAARYVAEPERIGMTLATMLRRNLRGSA